MNLQKIVVLCVVVVVLGGGWWYLSSSSSDNEAQSVTTPQGQPALETEETTTEEDSLFGTGSILDLVSLGESIRCEYTYSDESGEGSGTGYFDGRERMRVDAVTTQNGETFETHMINDGSVMYTWTTSAEESFAMMMPIPEGSSLEESFSGQTPEGAPAAQQELDTNVSYDCDRWGADENVFVPPADVEFMDMTQMFEGFPEMQQRMGQ